MYESFYHLKEHPFGPTPDPRFLYKSDGHREALAYLGYGVFQKKGFLALSGEVGIGKTTVIRAFVHTFHPCLEVAFVLNTKVSFTEMLHLILHDFGVEVKDTSKVPMLESLNAFLLERYAENSNTVIVIDEAQNLSADILEELRMLSNVETDQQKLLQIVLVGQPEFRDMLMRQELRQLRQRIPGILEMKPLRREEVDAYIDYRLQVAGLSNGHLRFTMGAQAAIFEHSEGIPRLVNLICERVLVRGYLRRTSTITENLVQAGVEELSGPLDSDWRSLSGENGRS
jgi:general secretion pathway protein A